MAEESAVADEQLRLDLKARKLVCLEDDGWVCSFSSGLLLIELS